jgi:hypothetical protein
MSVQLCILEGKGTWTTRSEEMHSGQSATPGARRRHNEQDQCTQLLRDGDHHLSTERRQAGNAAAEARVRQRVRLGEFVAQSPNTALAVPGSQFEPPVPGCLESIREARLGEVDQAERRFVAGSSHSFQWIIGVKAKRPASFSHLR